MSQQGPSRSRAKASVKDNNLQLDISIQEIPEPKADAFKRVYSQHRLKIENLENDESFESNLEYIHNVHN